MPTKETRWPGYAKPGHIKQVFISKWLFKLCNKDGIWQELLRNKYLKNKTLGQVNKKPGDSHFCMSLMGVKDTFLSLESFMIQDGTQIRFWEGICLGNQMLKS